MATPDQVAARRKLGTELRRLRVDLARSGIEVADQLGWNQSKVSRIERGQTMAQVDDVVALLDCYYAKENDRAELLALAAESIGGPGDWRNSTRAGFARRQADFIALERSARTIRHYHPIFIPGYMQTEPYARSVVEMAGVRNADRAVAVRLARRETMTAARGPSYRITLMESALYWRPFGTDEMADQLALLLDLAQRDNVSLRIVPFGERQSAFIQHPLMIFDFDGDTLTEALVETTTADHRITDPKPIEALARFFERVTSSALSESASMALIQRIMTALQSGQTD